MKNKASLGVIFVTIFIDLMGFGLLIPILPTFASKDLGINDFGIGFIIAVYSLMQFIFNPIFGKISDRVGRKPVIAVSLLMTATSYIIFSFAGSFLVLTLSRMLAGLGGSNIGVAQAYIADVTSKEERTKGMAVIGMAFGLGFVFGPVFGAFISQYGYPACGFTSAGFSFMAFLFAIFYLPESNLNRNREEKLKVKFFDFKYTKRVLSNPSLGLLITIFFIIVFSIANVYGTFALLGYKKFGFTDQENGLLFGIMGIVSALVQGGLIRAVSGKIQDRVLVLFGSITMVLGLAALPYGQDFLGVAIIIAVLSIGAGILQPTVISMVSKYAPDKEQGAILGLNSSFSALGRVLGPLWGGFAFDYIGYSWPFLTGAAFTLITFILAFIYVKQERLKVVDV